MKIHRKYLQERNNQKAQKENIQNHLLASPTLRNLGKLIPLLEWRCELPARQYDCRGRMDGFAQNRKGTLEKKGTRARGPGNTHSRTYIHTHTHMLTQ